MKKFIGVFSSILFSVLFASCFAVAGTIVNADPILVGSIGLLVSQIPVGISGLAIKFGMNTPADVKDSGESSNAIRQLQTAIIKELEPLMSKKASELTEDERNLWTKKYPELAVTNEQLRIALEREEVVKAQAAINGTDLSKDDRKTLDRFSFRKAILAATEGRALDGVEAEMHQEAVKEARLEGRSISGIGVPYLLLSKKPLSRASTGQNITTAGDGGYLKQEEPLMFLAALRNKLLLTQLGAKFITGLVGDFPLVTGSLFTANWLLEGAADADQKIAFTKAIMTPKRVQATGALALQLLKQSTPDVERLIEDELLNSIAQALQVAAINGSGAAGQPLGLLNVPGIGVVAGGANGLIPTWGNIVDLESAVLVANADDSSLAYLTNAKTRGKLKQVLKAAAATSDFIWDKDGMNGYKGNVTNAVPSVLNKGTAVGVCSAVIVAEWSKLFIAQWGGLDMIVDPYSLKKQAEVEVTALSFYDIACIYPAGFAAMKDALTA